MTEHRDRRGLRPRQADIARIAGVSQATVSLIVNGRGDAVHISLETRARVLQAVKQLGYVVNPAARKLAGGANGIIGVYTFETVFPTDQRDFYHPFLRGIEEAAAGHGLDLLLFTSAGPNGKRSLMGDAASRLMLADGCILLGRDAPVEDIAQLVRADFPLVFIGRRDIPGGALTYVTADYAGATAAVVEHLVGLGHERLAYVGEANPKEPSVDRERGFRMGVERAALDPRRVVVHRVEAEALSVERLRRWLDDGTTAICCEVLLLDTLEEAARSLGVHPPENFSLAALGDRPGSVAEEDTRTRFSIPRREVGRAAVDKLKELLDHWPERPAQPQVLMPCALVPGHTSAAVPIST